MKNLAKNRISCEKEFEMHVKMVYTFIKIRLAVLPMNQKRCWKENKTYRKLKKRQKYNRKPQTLSRQ